MLLTHETFIRFFLPQAGREVDDFIKYLAKESTDGLKGYDRDGKKKKKDKKKTEL